MLLLLLLPLVLLFVWTVWLAPEDQQKEGHSRSEQGWCDTCPYTFCISQLLSLQTQKIIYLECIPKTDLHVVVVVEWEGEVRSALPEVAIKWKTICCWETRFPATPPLLVPNKCEIKYWRWGPTLTVQKQTMSKKDEIYIDFPNSHSECWGASEVRNTQRQLLGLYLSVSNNKIRLIRFILRRITRRGK